MGPPLLVVVNGAIASGKDTVSRELAGLLEAEGRRAAVIGLDELWLMLDHQLPRTGGLEHWLLARKGAAVLTDTFFGSGIDAVIVNAPFFTPQERSEYLRHLETPVEALFVTLRVSFEESFRRAMGDPFRIKSKDRSWLAERHAASEVLVAPLIQTDLIIETDHRTPAEAAQTIAAALRDRGRARR